MDAKATSHSLARALHKNRGWFLVAGSAAIVLGVPALSLAGLMTLMSVVVFG